MLLRRMVAYQVRRFFRDFESVRALRHVNRRVRHISGTRSVTKATDSLTVLCVVKNGRYYIESFLDHYRNLGVKRIVILDNGSTDGTIELLSRNADVTVYRSPVPFNTYIVGLKRYLVSLYRGCGWVLVADIDEFFDYPGSGHLSLDRFLAYLNSNRYTVVTVQMLDMFGAFPEAAFFTAFSPDRFPFYDLSNLDVRPAPPIVLGRKNRYTNLEIPVYSGGIRMSSFGVKPWLSKHALFYGPSVSVCAYEQHVVGGARVADISALFRHYLFTPHFPEKCEHGARIRSVEQGGAEYQAYWSALKRRSPSDYLRPINTRRFYSVDTLVAEGFLHVSRAYNTWIEHQR